MSLFGLERRNDGPMVPLSGPVGALLDLFGISPTDSGVNVTTETALKYSAAFACMNVLGQTIAQVPWDVYRIDGKKRSVAKDRSEHWLLHTEPNGLMTSYTMRVAMMNNILGHGAGHIEIIRDGANRAKAMRPLPFHTVTVYPSLDEQRLVYKVVRKNGRMDTLDGSDVISIPYFTMDGITPLSPIALHRQGIGLGIAAEGASAALLGNGSVPPGYLQTDKGMRKEVREDVEKRWFQKVGGWRNRGKVPVLSEGLTWKSIAINPLDAQHLETRVFQASEVARIFRVPAVLIGLADKTSTYASADAFFLSFVKFTVAPLVQSIEQEFNRKLFPNTDEIYSRLDLNGLLRGDPKSRAEFYKTLWATSSLSGNDIRDWEELDPVDGGDRYWVQQGFMPLDRVDDLLDKQAQAGSLNAQKPQQDPGGDPNKRSFDANVRDSHVRWLANVGERVARWDKRDSDKFADQFLPVFRSYEKIYGREWPVENIGAFCFQLAADFDPADTNFAQRSIERFEETLQ